jgi:type IV pilus assembly protein PilV
MRTLPVSPPYPRQSGTTMTELLITLVILSIGLLGLAKFQAQLQLSQLEAYQRAQALVLLNDMAGRLANNRNHAAAYITTTPVGAGVNCPTATTTRQQADTNEWCNALQGAGETTGSSKLGAMIGGRGCIASMGSSEYLVTVAWQGLIPASTPPASVACGKDSYNGDTGAPCSDDRCRRAVTTLVRFAAL